MSKMTTIEKGDKFRDVVVSMLEAAGFVAESEIRLGPKKVDVKWRRDDIDGTVHYAIEAKDYEGNLTKEECREFGYEYSLLIENKIVQRAWLISKGPFSADGRDIVDKKEGLKALTFAEFQRRLLLLDKYLHSLVAKCEAEQIEDWYQPLYTVDNRPLESLIDEWIDEPEALPLAIIAGYGKGKSTFAQRLCARLAREALEDMSKRVPILIPLGDIMDEQSLEGLLGKVFTSTSGVINYNFEIFEKLNRSGRFVIFFDGFDEMKHGMTLEKFDIMIRELLRFDKENAKIVVLGRDTAFHDQYEFKAIVEGKQITSGGFEVPAMDRRQFRPVTIRDFTVEEAHRFIQRLFPSLVAEANKGTRLLKPAWISGRIAELTNGQFDELIIRPVHARMLCQIATNPDIELHRISKYGLFDRFVHFLLDREVSKRGRDKRFSVGVRRRFNASVALWLWRQGGASTVSLSHIPNSLFAAATETIRHDYDDIGLRRELTQGCLVDKNGTTVFFNHRSLQEFLVANAIVDITAAAAFQSANLSDCLRLLNEEIANFLLGGYCESDLLRGVLDRWFPALIGMEGQLSVVAIRLLTRLRMEGASKAKLSSDEPWHRWISFFMSNGGVGYELKTESHNPHELVRSQAQRFLSDYVADIAKYDVPSQAAAFTLLASVLRAKREQAESQYAVIWLAHWLSADLFEKAFAKTKGKGKYTLVYVQRDEDFCLWLFVKCCRLERINGEMNVVVDLKAMKETAALSSPIGIVEDISVEPNVHDIMLPAQVLYRVWGASERKLEAIRPFFFKPDYMEKLKTLDTVVRPARQGPQGSTGKESPLPRKVLTLPKANK